MVLPAAVRHLAELRASGLEELTGEIEPLIRELHFALTSSRTPTSTQPDVEASAAGAVYMRDRVIPAMDDVRDVADRLERIVADDLWPLPKYSEMLFIK